MPNLLVFDTETTGLNTDTNEIVEVAFQVINIEGIGVGKLMNTLVYTETKIPEEASAIHKITNDMLEGKPLPRAIIKAMEKHAVYYKCEAIVAHNIGFDINTLNKYVPDNSPLKELELVDTLRLSRRLLPEAENHKLGTLCEHYGLESDSFVGDYHSAGYDVSQTVELFKLLMEKLYDINTLGELVKYHAAPIYLETMPFGKHKGLQINAIPNHYRAWLKTIDLDLDLAYTLGVRLS